MIAGRVYNYDGIKDKLEYMGCKDSGKVLDAESQPHHLWYTPWDHPFLVPAVFATDWELEQIIVRDFDGTRPRFND
jgi:hypothetical protein